MTEKIEIRDLGIVNFVQYRARLWMQDGNAMCCWPVWQGFASDGIRVVVAVSVATNPGFLTL